MTLEWQYNGNGPFKDIVEWCESVLPYDVWDHEYETIYFYDEKYLTLFLLRWI